MENPIQRIERQTSGIAPSATNLAFSAGIQYKELKESLEYLGITGTSLGLNPIQRIERSRYFR